MELGFFSVTKMLALGGFGSENGGDGEEVKQSHLQVATTSVFKLVFKSIKTEGKKCVLYVCVYIS